MYINSLHMESFRTFSKSKVEFLHPGKPLKSSSGKTPRFNNVNLLLGNNGSGKTTLLKAIALNALAPIISSSGFVPYFLVRKNRERAILESTFYLHKEDVQKKVHKTELTPDKRKRVSHVTINRREDLEQIHTNGRDGFSADDPIWSEMYKNISPAFLIVGYGATRRVETLENYDKSTRTRRAVRYQRVQGLFEDSYSLVPLGSWLSEVDTINPRRYREVIRLINKLLPRPLSFSGDQEHNEYLFRQGKLKIPFDALSDGYRSYIGWIADLLYHINIGCPVNKRLADSKGIVMVDEIDLHLHPSWQREVVPLLSGTFKNLQFIVTSHSPILTGSLESTNILVLEITGTQSKLVRMEKSVYGLNADQILISEYFGLDSTRAPGTQRRIRDLNLKAMQGDADASLELLQFLADGEEPIDQHDDSL
ncbi:MAG: AAA family ATPase [bacterium]|nr:AAA family ATPase [bacterium]